MSNAAVISQEDNLQSGYDGMSPHARSGLGRRTVHSSEQESTSGSSDAEHAVSQLPAIHFCPDEPLCLEDVLYVTEVSSSPTIAWPTPEPSPGVPPSPTIRKWSQGFFGLGLMQGLKQVQPTPVPR